MGHMTFQAYCYVCEKTVHAGTILSDEDLWQALESGADVEVMHVSDKGDHLWKLNREERANLLKNKTGGFHLKKK
jgi:hypothetical protein